MNFGADFGKRDREQLIRDSKPVSRLSAFLFGALLSAVLFSGAIAFWLFVFTALLQEADMRAAKQAVIGISRMDARCIEWAERSDGWICVKR